MKSSKSKASKPLPPPIRAAAGLSAEMLRLSPLGCAQIIQAMLKKGLKDEALALASTVSDSLLPRTEEEWEGSQGRAISALMKLDPLGLIAPMVQSAKAQNRLETGSGKMLLIAAARGQALDCFDWLLEQGIARRGKKVLESAFQEGGWRVAEKVKEPTALETTELWDWFGGGRYSHAIRRKLPDISDLQWLSDRRLELGEPNLMSAKTPEQATTWFAGMYSSYRQVDPEGRFCCQVIQERKALRIQIDHDTAAMSLFKLACLGASEPALLLLREFKDLSNPKLSMLNPAELNYCLIPLGNGRFTHWAPGRNDAGYQQPSNAFKVPLILCALVSQDEALCRALVKAGHTIPSQAQLGQISGKEGFKTGLLRGTQPASGLKAASFAEAMLLRVAIDPEWKNRGLAPEAPAAQKARSSQRL